MVSVDARYELQKAYLEDPDLILSVRIMLPSGVTAKFSRSGPWRSAHDGATGCESPAVVVQSFDLLA
jgi:hypothetical protein